MCEYPVSDEAREYAINNIDDPKLAEYLELGIESLRKCSYNLSRIKNDFLTKNNVNWDNINKSIVSTFNIGGRFSKADIKAKLNEIYNDNNLQIKAKANDLEKWFEIKDVVIIENGIRIKGFEILGKLK